MLHRATIKPHQTPDVETNWYNGGPAPMTTGQQYTDIGSMARVTGIPSDTNRPYGWCRETRTVSSVTVKTDFLLNYLFYHIWRFI